eukprot:Awhi_evm1s15392
MSKKIKITVEGGEITSTSEFEIILVNKLNEQSVREVYPPIGLTFDTYHEGFPGCLWKDIQFFGYLRFIDVDDLSDGDDGVMIYFCRICSLGDNMRFMNNTYENVCDLKCHLKQYSDIDVLHKLALEEKWNGLM